MSKIKVLDKNLINQIAAGEVIERPASIVKELVENSIDAGANRISVDIDNDCRNIRVADNGSGISKDDLLLAFTRHATSKIAEEKDLWNIETLGFRGEALASMISVAKVTCTTKTKDDEVGNKAECVESEVKITETGCAEGTIMDVKNLFFNIPARLKFLKKSQTEYAYILEIMQSIAISHPEIAFNVNYKGSNGLKTTGSNDIEVVISEIYSKQLIDDLVLVSNVDNEAQMSVSGVVSSPKFTRSNKKAIYLFVNGRTVKCPIQLKAIDNAYSDLIASGRYPFVILSLDLAPGDVDVNVHPSKKEVRYVNTNLVYNFIYSSVKNALQKVLPPVKTESEPLYFENKQDDFIATPRDNFRSNEGGYRAESTFFSKPKIINSDKENVTQQTFIEKFNEPLEISRKFNIIGQFRNTYILVETKDGLQIIDQHIAHERYLYETLLAKVDAQETIPSQLFFTSEEILLEPVEIALLKENEEMLEKYGYKFEFIEDKKVMFKQVPQIISGKSPEKVIFELLEALNSSLDKREDEILITTSCKAAVKAGEKLSIWQMQELLEQWATCKHPETCPHGRPISHIIEEKNIAKFFHRTVKV